jgi:hypothetical protein
LDPANYRWPTAGDRLLVAATEEDGGAAIERHGYSRLVFMTDGYKVAADILVEEAIADRISRYDLIYPILFCYRQFIELSLKGLIESYGARVGVRAPGNIHDLKKLLKSFRRVLRQYDAPSPGLAR